MPSGIAPTTIDLADSAPIRRVCLVPAKRLRSFRRAPIDALDLGCGTGRYFCALRGVRTLVGLDASAAMLERARHPMHEDQITIGAHDARAR